MENALYAVNLMVHIIAAVGCVAGPYYQLRMVNQRGKLYGTGNLIYPVDELMERILTVQPRLCYGLILTLIGTGLMFPVIDYGFHGMLTQVSSSDWVVGSLKALLALTGLGIVIYGIRVVDPQIQGLFGSFSPDADPPAEDLARFWALRKYRKKLCTFCLWLGLSILLITPVMRFF
ncbi:MAG: hypothetical protein HYU66_14525 [Armatimonadetes bacterium]|nr:hypothetical protein [Armatimonadota bacterium]